MALFDATIGLRVRNATYRSYYDGGPDEITDATAGRDLRQLGRFYLARPELTKIRTAVRSMRDRRDDSDPFASEAVRASADHLQHATIQRTAT